MPDYKPNAIVIGVTGGIACGKTEVGRILEKMGFLVCDADSIAHELMKKGTPVYRQIVDFFGENILTDEGEVFRPALGKIVFDNPEQRDVLNRLVHPAVRNFITDWIEKKRSAGQQAAVLLPLLFESGMQDLDWDAVICVSSSEDAVFQRLENRGLNSEEAEKRIRSQMPLVEKERLADYVVSNDGTLGELELATRKIVQVIVG
jgi:dephospho-CoA kinase